MRRLLLAAVTLLLPVQARALTAEAPLPGHACAMLRGTPDLLVKARVPIYDRPDPQARLPLRVASGQNAIAPFLVLVHFPERVERGMVAMTTYDHLEGWIAANALEPPLPLSACQPSVMSNGGYGAAR